MLVLDLRKTYAQHAHVNAESFSVVHARVSYLFGITSSYSKEVCEARVYAKITIGGNILRNCGLNITGYE